MKMVIPYVGNLCCTFYGATMSVSTVQLLDVRLEAVQVSKGPNGGVSVTARLNREESSTISEQLSLFPIRERGAGVRVTQCLVLPTVWEDDSYRVTVPYIRNPDIAPGQVEIGDMVGGGHTVCIRGAFELHVDVIATPQHPHTSLYAVVTSITPKPNTLKFVGLDGFPWWLDRNLYSSGGREFSDFMCRG